MKLQLCNNGKSVVGTDDNGNMVSYLTSAKEYIEWLSEGNTPEPEFTEEELTQQNVQLIKAKAEQLITARYPNFKQLNIIRAGGEELVSMSAYIDGIRAISNKAELAGTDVNDINWEVL